MNGRRLTAALVILAVIATSAAVVGCGSTQAGKGGQIEGVNWALESYGSQGTMQDIPGDISIDALFEGSRVSGSSGVNTYTAPYELSGASLTIGMAATTMMAGPEALMAVEQAYLTALQESASYTVSGGALVIFDKDGEEILSYVEEEAFSLTGGTWTVTGYNNGKQAVVTPASGSVLTAAFAEGGTVSGSGGINTFSGPYEATGNNIKIGPLVATLMAGDPALMEQETAYLAALQSASRFSIKGGELQLRRDDGALAVSFTSK